MVSASTTNRPWRRAVAYAVGLLLFVESWLFRFNDPNGSFAGLTDDHFFYLVRGWQILFGDLPVRDFVDHGAPLFYYIGAAVQLIGGRGTVSEIAFCVTVLSACAVGVYVLVMRVTGSIALGAAAALVHILMLPRFYNYPKILVYVAAIPAVWAFIDRPTIRRTFVVALVTAVGFLFRHDHGVFVAVAMAAALLFALDRPLGHRVRDGAIYLALVVLILSPYLVFIQTNGGFVSYIAQAAAWGANDRDRAPVVFPGPFDEAVPSDAWGPYPLALLRQNATAVLYYVEIAIPIVAGLVLALTKRACRPTWSHARLKLSVVALLALALDAGFLRSPLAARLADPSVPLLVLLGWLVYAAWYIVKAPGEWLPASVGSWATPVAASVATGVAVVTMLVGVTTTVDALDRLQDTPAFEGLSSSVGRARSMMDRLAPWPLERWSNPTEPGVMRLTFYLRDCTRPTDRVLLQYYLPQVLALAQRGFAGGHADLRPGFFGTQDAQELTVARLRRQSVPVVVLETGESLANFRKAFPTVTAYLDEHYESAGERALDERFKVHLLVRRDTFPTRHYAPLDWPCYA